MKRIVMLACACAALCFGLGRLGREHHLVLHAQSGMPTWHYSNVPGRVQVGMSSSYAADGHKERIINDDRDDVIVAPCDGMRIQGESRFIIEPGQSFVFTWHTKAKMWTASREKL